MGPSSDCKADHGSKWLPRHRRVVRLVGLLGAAAVLLGEGFVGKNLTLKLMYLLFFGLF